LSTYQVCPLPYLLGNALILGQSLFTILFEIPNIIFAAVNMESRQPNVRYPNRWREIMIYVPLRRSLRVHYCVPCSD
ncbi:hypothetical protein CC78DRAFT_478271, partial [Lojkania enalia]